MHGECLVDRAAVEVEGVVGRRGATMPQMVVRDVRSVEMNRPKHEVAIRETVVCAQKCLHINLPRGGPLEKCARLPRSQGAAVEVVLEGVVRRGARSARAAEATDPLALEASARAPSIPHSGEDGRANTWGDHGRQPLHDADPASGDIANLRRAIRPRGLDAWEPAAKTPGRLHLCREVMPRNGQ